MIYNVASKNTHPFLLFLTFRRQTSVKFFLEVKIFLF